MAEKKKTFEQAMIRLEEIVTQLEKGEAPLEESLKLFEEGMTLMKQCSALLDKAEQKAVSYTHLVESALQDKLYGRDINWKQVGISAGIGGLAGFVGGEGASAPVKTVYGKIVGAGGVNTSVVYLIYSSRATAEAAAKSLSKGMTKGSLTQIIVTDNVVKFIYVE